MTNEKPPIPFPADVLARQTSAFPGLPEVVRRIKDQGLIEYGEPLSVHSHVVVKTIVTTGDASSIIQEHREPITAANALDNAIGETIDAACYAIAAQQCCNDRQTTHAIGVAIWQLIHALNYLHQIRQGIK